ncbi:MAG: gephyrin-like molybdotransferase Glp [Pseudomonadota bacterium]
MIVPPPLKDDCFALPPGVYWTPVDEALTRLRQRLRPVTQVETVPVAKALGRVLAQDVHACRSNPPAPNAAVDGYGFAHAALGVPPHHLPLHPGRAAAGTPFEGTVPAGHALRILTGAMLPEGIDTVVLEEDVAVDETGAIAFQGGIGRGANTRQAGEDVATGDLALPAGHVLRPHDFALLTALGVIEVQVRKRLRVGILSTGDELVEPGNEAGPDRIFDANRPMLLALAEIWGFEPIDLGRAPDRRKAVQGCLQRAARRTDAILTSGGASAGDEDHLSAVLRTYGTLNDWRIAMKPGRPLALAMWQGVPVFGLPGNPVAAFVCALIFARPALTLLSGAGWTQPLAVSVPAAFEKRKKAGRREYLRARLDAQGRAQVFHSEGSGRISGLSWAEGLIELPDGEMRVVEDTPVRFLPYSGFGF